MTTRAKERAVVRAAGRAIRFGRLMVEYVHRLGVSGSIGAPTLASHHAHTEWLEERRQEIERIARQLASLASRAARKGRKRGSA